MEKILSGRPSRGFTANFANSLSGLHNLAIPAHLARLCGFLKGYHHRTLIKHTARKPLHNPVLWWSGYHASLESWFLRERKFESCQHRVSSFPFCPRQTRRRNTVHYWALLVTYWLYIFEKAMEALCSGGTSGLIPWYYIARYFPSSLIHQSYIASQIH